ncbi:MAG: hypothetical protein HY820_22630 [Acidobacteria bacterium]|nr:hypothetical protein [Acidobacteriota bacterium]
MKDTFREASHLVRLVVVLAVAIVAFLGLRGAVVPKDFGQYGHYRPGALEDSRAKPIVFAGQQDCVVCHEDQAKARDSGRHARITCEACHGPQAKHVEDPSNKPKLPQVSAICTNCHEKDVAKPKWLPQQVTKDHANGMECNSCHKPHAPKMG